MSVQRIVAKARSIGLDVEALTPTPGDGNCFYYSVIQTLSITNRPYHGNFNDLRQEIVYFVDSHRETELVQSFLDFFTPEEIVDLDSIIKRQYQPGTYANELFIQATAVKLNILLLVTKQDSSALYPFSKFWPTEYRADDNATVSSFTGTKVIIGHANDHFQSLKFIEKNNVDKNTVESSQSSLLIILLIHVQLNATICLHLFTINAYICKAHVFMNMYCF